MKLWGTIWAIGDLENYLGNYWRLSYPIGEEPIGDKTDTQGW